MTGALMTAGVAVSWLVFAVLYAGPWLARLLVRDRRDRRRLPESIDITVRDARGRELP